MKKLLALDFDGVIWDSAGECFQVGWRAYQELTGRELSTDVYEQGFLHGRPLARTGHDFYLLLSLLEQEPGRDLRELSLEQFSEYRLSQATHAAEFDRIFYRLRSHYRDSEAKQWVSWQKPYYQVLQLLDDWEDEFFGLALATTKDTQSAKNLLALTGRDWPIFGKEFSEHKADQIFGIAQHYKVPLEDILFIDDLVENLLQVEPTKAQVALAAWGYNLPQAREQAMKDGRRVVTLDNLTQLFQEFLGRSA